MGYLARGQSEATKEGDGQRMSFWVPALQEEQKLMLASQGDPTAAAQADGRVNVIFNPYRQVAAVAIPSISTLFKIHTATVPLKVILDTQPQVKIVPELEDILANKKQCPIVSLGRDMHFILLDITTAPNMLAALTASTGTAKSLDDYVKLDEGKGWHEQAFKNGFLGTVWFVRGAKDEVKGEATIENLKCRCFGDVGTWEEEGLGSAAAVLGGWLAVNGETDVAAEALVEDVQALKVDDTTTESPAKDAGEDVADEDAGEVVGAEVTPTQSARDKVERKVFGIQMGVEMGRNSTVAVEVDVRVDRVGKRNLGGMVVSGRANFESKGELLGA